MNLLLERKQRRSLITRRVTFKLWGKLEIDEEEQSLIDHYGLAKSVLIEVSQLKLIRNTLIVAVGVALLYTGFGVLMIVTGAKYPSSLNSFIIFGIILGIIAGFLFYHWKRETIFVSDLLRGRTFRCKSIIELAKKEAWLTGVLGYFRQVMESAKHWDGTEVIPIEALPREEAKRVMIENV